MALNIPDSGYYRLTGFNFTSNTARFEIYKNREHRESGDVNFLRTIDVNLDMNELSDAAKDALKAAGYDAVKQKEMFSVALDC